MSPIPPAAETNDDPAKLDSAGPATRRVIGWFLLTSAVLVAVASSVYSSMSGLIDQSRWVAHSHEVLAALRETAAQARDVEVAQRGYVLTGEPEYLAAYHDALARIPRGLERLRRLTAGNEVQQPRLDQLEAKMAERLASLADVLATFERAGLASAQDQIRAGVGRRAAEGVAAAIRSVEDEERRLLRERQGAAELAARATLTIGGGCLATCFLVLAVALTLVLREWSCRRRIDASLRQANDRLEASLGELNERAGEAALVAALGDYLQACRTPREAYNVLGRAIPHLLPGVAGAVAITCHSRTQVDTVLSWGEPGRFAPVFHPDECWGLRRGRPHLGVGCDPVCEHLEAPRAGDLCLPMAVHGETLGVLSLSTDRPGGLTERERNAARAVAEQVSLALANLRLQEALRDQSIRDPLTGLFNRRYLEESLGRELCRARRHEQPVAVVMADVDHFKRFNDAHGHEAGDAVLAEVGRLMARYVRGEDVACRFGGEEFCLILPGAGPEVARLRAEEIREAVARLNIRHNQRPLGPITLSAGVAASADGAEDSLIAAADAALYVAKREGRDRVVVAETPRLDESTAAEPTGEPAAAATAVHRNGHHTPPLSGLSA